MITMTEIAKLTGVSQATVSRVLNGNTGVDSKTAERVLACARKYNYQPNMIARSLNAKGKRPGRTNLLALIVSDVSNPFFADLIRAVEAEAMKSEYSILIFNSDNDPAKERKFIDILMRYRVDGMLLAPVSRYVDALAPFFTLTIPWLAVTNQVDGRDSFFISHKKAGASVAEHILGLGAKKFIYVGKRSDEKCAGYKERLERSGVDTVRDFRCFLESEQSDVLAALTGYMKGIADRVGIFACNDVEAITVLNTLVCNGIRVPEQAVLAGFDDTVLSRNITPGITSVHQPIEEMGRLGVQRLLARIGGDRGPVSYVELEARLMERESTVGIQG